MIKHRIVYIFSLLFLAFPSLQAIILFSSIDSPGYYQLAADVTNQITINVSNVTLDLQGHSVSGGTNGILIQPGLSQIIVQNGVVSGSANGVLVSAGASNITLENITAKNSVLGISLSNVSNVYLDSCEMTMNTTGLQLDHAHKVTVKDCVASSNVFAGYDLISSTTNTFDGCQAVATGVGNTQAFGNNVFGFVTSNGSGNIFENCIANSTQALTTTDYNSFIAGFGLKGSESCSKIIRCEAANSVADDAGITKPYGIYFEPQMEGLLTFTQITVPTAGVVVAAIRWSPSGRYVAYLSVTNFIIYEFNPVGVTYLTEIARLSMPATSGGDIAWSPDERYVIASNLSPLTWILCAFTPGHSTVLTPIEQGTAGVANISSIDWHPSGNFIVQGLTGTSVLLYEFRPDQVNKMVLVQSLSTTTSVRWSPDGKYLLTASDISLFTPGIPIPLVSVVSKAAEDRIAWSPDGRYIAGGTGSTQSVNIYEFDRKTNMLLLISTTIFEPAGGRVDEITWSPDGKIVAVSGRTPVMPNPFRDPLVKLYRFDPTLSPLPLLANVTIPPTADVARPEISWSPDGRFLGCASLGILIVFNVMNFPEKNVIQNNLIYCCSNLSSVFARGVGISGSNIVNMIMGNTSYNNPQSYEDITNIFDGLSNGIPSPLQNTGILGCQPPAITSNIVDCLDILKSQANDAQSKIDALVAALL